MAINYGLNVFGGVRNMKRRNGLNILLVVSIVLSFLVMLVFGKSTDFNSDTTLNLDTNDEVVFKCTGPATGKTSIEIYKYFPDGSSKGQSSDTVNLQESSGSNNWTCTETYGKSAANATSTIKVGDKIYAPICNKFQCATKADAQVFCQIIPTKSNTTSSAYTEMILNIPNRCGLYSVVGLLITSITSLVLFA